MTVYANLVIGLDGSTSAEGRSAKLSSDTDRKRFHQLRERADVIFIGGETARREPYGKTPVPLVIVSKFTEIKEISENKNALIINKDPQSALQIAIEKYGPNVLIEGGPNLLLNLINFGDELYITIANRYGDGQIVSFDGLTREFIMEEMEKIEGEIFYRFIRER